MGEIMGNPWGMPLGRQFHGGNHGEIMGESMGNPWAAFGTTILWEIMGKSWLMH
jgi:hypothetical protein